MQPPPPYPPAAAPGNDRTTLFGVLGIVIGVLCCSPAGIVFGVLSMQHAKRNGKPNTLGIVAIALSAVSLIVGGIITASRLSS
jgi:hypothetical protein